MAKSDAADREPPGSPAINVAAIANKIIANVEKVIIGKRPQLPLCLVAYFCEGHILLEDVPGVAKTMLARALARSVGCTFKRIQCTPDLLPTDVTGVSVFNQKTTEFEFRPGPPRAPSRPCSKRWASGASPPTARPTRSSRPSSSSPRRTPSITRAPSR